MNDITLLLNDSYFKALLGEEDEFHQLDKLTFDGLIPFLKQCSRIKAYEQERKVSSKKILTQSLTRKAKNEKGVIVNVT